MALLAAAAVCGLLHWACFPVVNVAIRQLPIRGDIVDGRMPWTNATPILLAGNPILAIVVDPEHTGQLGQTADLQVEFGRTNIHFSALLGYAEIPYPDEIIAAFNRTDLVPWWGAWSQALLGCTALGMLLWLMFVWAALALLYMGPAKAMATIADRALGWRGAWRLCSAALMPGACLVIGATVLYSLTVIDLVRFGFFIIFHLVVGWIYIFASIWCLPKMKVMKSNPFTSVASLPGSSNPFSTEPQANGQENKK